MQQQRLAGKASDHASVCVMQLLQLTCRDSSDFFSSPSILRCVSAMLASSACCAFCLLSTVCRCPFSSCSTLYTEV